MYFYEYFNPYLTIENGIIKTNNPFGKKMNLTEIKRIKKFAGDYILKTDKAELTKTSGKKYLKLKKNNEMPTTCIAHCG